MNDTSPLMEKKMRELILEKTPLERLKMGCSMYETSRSLVKRAIIENNPSISEKELREEVFLRFYKDDFSSEECQKIMKHLRTIV